MNTSQRTPALEAAPVDVELRYGEPDSAVEPARAKTRRGRWLHGGAALAIVAAGVGIATWMYKTQPVVEPAPPVEQSYVVRTVTLDFAQRAPRVSAFGEVVAGRLALLRPLVPGRIVEVHPRLLDGAFVAAGETLVAIDPFDYEAAVEVARADLVEARGRLDELRVERRNETRMREMVAEQLELRQRDLDRSARLRRAGNASAQAADEAAIAVNAAEQKLQQSVETGERLASRETQVQAAVQRAEAALRRRERELANAVLSAPFAGHLARVDAAVGKNVSVGDTVAELIDPSQLEVRFELSEGDFARLLARDDAGLTLSGRSARVVWAVGEQRFEYAAEVDRVAARLDAASGGVTVYARIVGALTGGEGAATGPLRTGAFVDVGLRGEPLEHVARVPDTALDAEGNVYRVVAEGEVRRLEAVPVRRRARDGEALLVSPAPGAPLLASGDRVVRDVFPGVADGLKVRVPDRETGGE